MIQAIRDWALSPWAVPSSLLAAAAVFLPMVWGDLPANYRRHKLVYMVCVVIVLLVSVYLVFPFLAFVGIRAGDYDAGPSFH